MTVGLTIVGSPSGNKGEVDAGGQSRVILYDASGAIITPANRGAVSETAGGAMNAGKDYKLARTLRASSFGSLHIGGDESMMLYDSFEGTTRDSNKWVETATTMASAQTLAVGETLNSGSITTINTGVLESSHRQFPFIARAGLIFRARIRNIAVTNSVAEFGFSDCSSATTALINNGAFFRKDAANSLQPVLSFNGTEVQGSTMTAPATTDYVTYEIFLEDSRATFQIVSSAGVLIAAQVMEIGATVARIFALTHISVFRRLYNTGSAPGSAPQLITNHISVTIADTGTQRDYRTQQSGMNYNAATSPTTYLQNANWTNNAAPTVRTLSNTAAAETTLGGLLAVNSIAGGNNDLIMFGWQNPAPYTFYCDGVWIPPPLNQVVAVAGTATIFAYFMAFNSSAVSLATAGAYPPMRVVLPGIHTAAVALAANALFSGPQIFVQFLTPYAVQPGRFLHIGCRELVGTATATETYLWGGVGVGGFFE